MILSLFSCTESETEISIRDMIFNQNNTETANKLPKSNVLTFNTTSVNFGTIQNGSSGAVFIQIRNSHNEAVNVTLTHTNSITQITFDENSFQIPANGIYQFIVTFSPTATMFLNDTLRFSYPANVSNNTGSLVQNITLAGNSVAVLPTTLTISPTGTIDFGDVLVGKTVTKNLTLSNTGNAIANWLPQGASFTTSPSSGTILAGASQSIVLSYTAIGVGIVNNTFGITYNGGTLSIPYTINKVAETRILGVSAVSTNFGNVPVGTTATKTFVITNTGNSDLTISSLKLSQFSPNLFSCNYSGVIPPNQSITVNITFTPSSKSSQSCTISFTSDKTSGTTSFSFLGTGI